MAWDRTVPSDDTKVKAADDAFRDNFGALDDALGREHVFAGDGASAEGYHKPGLVGVIYVGSTSACSALASKEGCGAFCYDTSANCFQSWNGVEWRKYDHIKTSGDTLIVDWYVPGSFIDGRDPSVDGARLDTMAPYGDYIEIVEVYQFDHEDIIPVPGAFLKEQCQVFIHNQADFNLAASDSDFYLKDLYCWTHDPAAAPASTGWQVVSQIGFGFYGSSRNWGNAYAYGLVIGVVRE